MKLPIRLACIASCCAFLAACGSLLSQPVSLPPPSPPPPTAPGEPAGLFGISASKLQQAFGTPAFVRKDGPDQMWRYDSQNCKAFFFLYPDAGKLTVRHVETLPRGQQIAADPTCLAALRLPPSMPPSVPVS